MSDNKKIIVSIQGKRGGGKTQLALQAIKPALLAVGAVIEKENDGDTGVFFTITLPPNSLAPLHPDGLKRVYSQSEMLAAIETAARGAGGDAEAPAEDAPASVGFGNFDRVQKLVAARRELEPYADAAKDMAGTVARMALPKSLAELTQPDALIAQLRKDACAGIEKIDAELLALGFDISPVDPA